MSKPEQSVDSNLHKSVGNIEALVEGLDRVLGQVEHKFSLLKIPPCPVASGSTSASAKGSEQKSRTEAEEMMYTLELKVQHVLSRAESFLETHQI